MLVVSFQAILTLLKSLGGAPFTVVPLWWGLYWLENIQERSESLEIPSERKNKEKNTTRDPEVRVKRNKKY